MLAELITITTEDKLTHFGAIYHPRRGAARALGVVLVHGYTGSFIGEVESALPPALAEAGYTCLVANNRGNGILGAATERFVGCLTDIRAAIDALSARGYPRIALLGHSKGGVKVAYYLSQTRDPRVAALGLLSPAENVHGIPRWLKARTATPTGKEMMGAANPDGWFSMVRELVERGKADYLFAANAWPPRRRVRQAGPYLASAGMVWDHHNTTDDDVAALIPSLKVPKLALCGEQETEWCTVVSGLRKEPLRGCRVEVIPGADHVYTGQEAALAEVVLSWLESL